MADKYSCTTGEKTLKAMGDIAMFRMERDIEKVLDRYYTIIADVKKVKLIKKRGCYNRHSINL